MQLLDKTPDRTTVVTSVTNNVQELSSIASQLTEIDSSYFIRQMSIRKMSITLFVDKVSRYSAIHITTEFLGASRVSG